MYKNSNCSQNPIIIIGTGRCGTTLLASMLNCHPNIAAPPESFFWNTFSNLLSYYGDLKDSSNMHRFIDDVLRIPHISVWSPKVTKDQILENLGSPTPCGVYRSLMTSWCRLNGKSRWAEHTPHNIFYWKEINECMPNTKVIHIVRDGRDVALSYINARFGPKTIYSAAKHWSHCLSKIEIIKSSIHKERFHELRYEELIEKPEHSLSAVCEFLNERYLPEMLDFYKNPVHYEINVYDKEHINISKPLMKENISRWQRNMSKQDIRIFESIGSSELNGFGYGLVYGNMKLSLYEIIYMRYIENPIKKFYAMLINKKGQREALSYLLIRMRIWLRYIIHH